MLRTPDAAAPPAAVAVRKGGRSLPGVLAHARYEALTASADTDLGDPTLGVPEELGALAWALAATRPPLEVAVVDLDTRHGLRRVGLGRSLGLAPAAAAERATAIAAAWEAELDPALMAWMGPGDCEELGAVLEGIGPASTVADLLGVVGAVAEHTEHCDVCADRRRAMVSVRGLLAQTPLLDAPPALRSAERRRIHRPSPLPPSVDPGPRSWLRWAAAAVLISVAIGGATAGAVTLTRRGTSPQEKRIQALTKIPPAGSSLVLSPSTVPPGGARLAIANRSSKELGWTVQSDMPWLAFTPASGRLGPKGSAIVTVTELRNAPEGSVRAEIRVSASDGSTAAAEMAGDVERPPDVSASIDACNVTAAAEDAADISAVSLHWRAAPNGVETTRAMAESDQGYVAPLPGGPDALTWWVTATDGRGNTARTPDATLAPGTC
ncbi:MAG: BACON domain-containing protein [Actinobacteria bacterium]|nr:BACON domain-containing protein [Actinomycetota bacterium]